MSECRNCSLTCKTCEMNESNCTSCSIESSLKNGTCIPKGCGNGIVEVGEECDDEYLIHDDGCSVDCTIEPGYLC